MLKSNAQFQFEMLPITFQSNRGVNAICKDINDSAFYVCGGFSKVNGIVSNSIVKIKNDTVVNLPYDSNFKKYIMSPKKMIFYKGKLYVGGLGLARLDSTGWTILDSLHAAIYSFYIHNDTLLIGGIFDSIGNLKTNAPLVQFDGTNFYKVPGLDTIFTYPNLTGTVGAIEYYKDNLYLGGAFLSFYNNDTIGHLMKFENNHWTGVDGGASIYGLEEVVDLSVHNDVLYVSGSFRISNGAKGNNIATWNGVKWNSIYSDFANGSITKMLWDEDTLITVGPYDYTNQEPAHLVSQFYDNNWCYNKFNLGGFVMDIIKFNNSYYIVGLPTIFGNDTMGKQYGETGIFKLISKKFISDTNNPTGISHPTIPPSYLTIYPNPSKETLYLEADKLMPKIKQTQVYNIAGQLVSEYYNMPSEIDLSKMASGVYFIQLSFENQSPPLHKIFQKE